MTYPLVPVFSAGFAPLATDFDTLIQPPLTFLTSKVVFRAEHHGTTTLTAGTFVLIPYDTILDDPFSGWNAGSSTWTPPSYASGWYEVTTTAFGTNPAVATDQIAATVAIAGGASHYGAGWGVNGHATGTTAGVIIYMSGGVTAVAGHIFSQAGTTTTGIAGQYPTIEIVWVSQ